MHKILDNITGIGREITTMKKIPAYMMVYDQLKEQIKRGEYPINTLLPTEPELEKCFEVSRTTIRKAVELLAREGFVQVKQGKGTTVLMNRTRQSLNLDASITETLIHKGCEVSSKSMYIDRIEAKGEIAENFSVLEGTELVRIQRIQLANQKPVAIMTNYLLPDRVPEIKSYSNRFYSLYKFLEETYGVEIEAINTRVSAKEASFAEAEMLQVPIGTALTIIKRICLEKGRPICVDRVSILGESYEFKCNKAI